MTYGNYQCRYVIVIFKNKIIIIHAYWKYISIVGGGHGDKDNFSRFKSFKVPFFKLIHTIVWRIKIK